MDLKFVAVLAYVVFLYSCPVFILWQDPGASYDVNGHDSDPQPRYDFTNENRFGAMFTSRDLYRKWQATVWLH